MSFTTRSVLCPTFVIAPCAHDYVLSPTTDVSVSFFSSKLILVSNTCDFMVFGSKPREGTNLKSSIKDVLKSYFLDLNEKEVENVNKGSRKINKHVELWVKNAFDQWNFFHGFDTTRSIADLSKDESSITDLAFFFQFASCKKGWQLVSSNQVTFTSKGLGCYGNFLDIQIM